MAKLKLIQSPRLYVNADTAENLKDKLHSPYLQSSAEALLRDADWLVRLKPLREDEVVRGYQAITRPICSYLECLTCAWVLTRKPGYRKAAMKHLAGLLEFNHISCEANRSIPAEKELPFCLSYGELCQSVALMYDLFRPEITDDEQQIFLAVLDKFLMRAAVKCLTNPPWWVNKVWSNWNGVCAGGMGLMALAFYDDHKDAKRLLPFVEKSLGEYFKSYIENGGGCAEGTGYWNYGMNYSIRYLLSWENATGKKHPALKIKELGKSLFFPLDFTGITFGDNDGWHPACFYFMLAKRMKQKGAALNAATYLLKPVEAKAKRRGERANHGDLLYAADYMPTMSEMERLRKDHQKTKAPVGRVYKGLGWAALADDEAFPALRMAVRGGSSKVTGHGMLDLLSFRCRVNGELMITDQQDGGYMATTFGGRGHEIYGRSPESKSTIFVDGISCGTDVECDRTEVVKGEGVLGIRIDASHIIIPRWKDHFIGRLVLMVDNAYWLVVDHVLSPNPESSHWLESRFHTLAESRRGKDWVSLKKGKERLQMTFACLGKSVIQESLGMPSQPHIKQTTIYRWMGTEAVHDNLHVVALNPGSKKLRVKVTREQNSYALSITKPDGGERIIRITKKLKVKK